MSNLQFITTSELAAQRGVSTQAIRAQVKRGTLTPAFTTSGGHHLFAPEPAKATS